MSAAPAILAEVIENVRKMKVLAKCVLNVLRILYHKIKTLTVTNDHDTLVALGEAWLALIAAFTALNASHNSDLAYRNFKGAIAKHSSFFEVNLATVDANDALDAAYDLIDAANRASEALVFAVNKTVDAANNVVDATKKAIGAARNARIHVFFNFDYANDLVARATVLAVSAREFRRIVCHNFDHTKKIVAHAAVLAAAFKEADISE
jgi:hypothetical protein